MKIDLHTHSRVSDGTDTPTSLVMKAFEAGLDVIALTDHDTFGGVAEAQEAGKRIGAGRHRDVRREERRLCPPARIRL